jgi:hypothetical protein
MARRIPYDPFAQNHNPHRMRVVDMTGRLLAKRDVPAGADLRAEINAEAARWAAAGWTIERDGGRPFRFPTFFMNRAAERRLVSLAPTSGGIGQTNDLFTQDSP